VSERKRTSETGVDLGQQPIWQGTYALFVAEQRR
jgi:hypothetical protein